MIYQYIKTRYEHRDGPYYTIKTLHYGFVQNPIGALIKSLAFTLARLKLKGDGGDGGSLMSPIVLIPLVPNFPDYFQS